MPVEKYFTGFSSPVKHYNQFLINALYSLKISENLWTFGLLFSGGQKREHRPEIGYAKNGKNVHFQLFL